MTWKSVTAATPCPICGGDHRCSRKQDAICCFRSETAPAGWRVGGKGKTEGVVFVPTDAPALNGTSHRDFAADAKRYAEAVTDDLLRELADALGVSAGSLQSIGTGWRETDSSWTCPEFNPDRRAIGINRRFRNGTKRAIKGSKRGLIIPDNLDDLPGPVLAVEGASDVASSVSRRIAAVGRPSNKAGADLLAKLLRDRADEVLIVGENDAKEDGTFPGRDGAIATAKKLAAQWKQPVRWTMPPEGVKDIRAWQGDRDDLLAVLEVNAETIEPGDSDSDEEKPKVSQAELLVQLAERHYRFGRTEDDEPFAVVQNGPAIAHLFRGSRDALRSQLAKLYRREYERTANATALSDAMTTLRGDCLDAEAEPVHLRVADHKGEIVIDLGTADGSAIVVSPDGWQVVNRSPVLFRRTALTGAMPVPERGGSVEVLRVMMNCSPQSWPIILGWAVASFMPSIPHPILLFGGPQGTGKSTSARMLAGLIDPSSATLRTEPRDVESWAMQASGSWLVPIDNVSSISAWWSDALCKAVTGDGWVRRKLYTDSELSVLSFRRVVMLTSIDAGAMRGDLGDRLVLADLDSITPEQRRTEAELDAEYHKHRASIFGALLDLLVIVLRELPTIQLREHPRMADFARVLAVLDREGITDEALNTYTGQRGRIAQDVIEGDVVAQAIVKLIEDKGTFTGTATELLAEVAPEKPGRAWPQNGRGMAGRLRRLLDALRSVGVIVHDLGRTGANGSREWSIERGGEQPSVSSEPSENAAGDIENGDCGTDGPTDGTDANGIDRQSDRQSQNRDSGLETANTERTDGSDGRSRTSSEKGLRCTL